MKPDLLFAGMHDAGEIYRVMHDVKEALEDKELYCADEMPYILENIENKGFTVKACDNTGHIMGFLIVHFPKEEADNLGHYLDLDDEACKKVAYMDSIAVLPECRGMGLQQKLLAYAESAEQMRPYQYLMATVSPKNPYSLRNFETMGYQIVCKVQKYNAWDRYVLCKPVNN